MLLKKERKQEFPDDPELQRTIDEGVIDENVINALLKDTASDEPFVTATLKQIKFITKGAFEALIQSGKNLRIVIFDENDNVRDIFEIDNITNPMDLDLTMNDISDNEDLISQLIGKYKFEILSFVHHGDLPG